MRPDEIDQLVAAMDQSVARFTRGPVGHDLEHTLTEIVTGAVAAVPAATAAGLTVLEPDGHLTSSAPTGQVVARLDHAQAVLREGPCVSAVLDPDPKLRLGLRRPPRRRTYRATRGRGSGRAAGVGRGDGACRRHGR
jgi:hypothetical protein